MSSQVRTVFVVDDAREVRTALSRLLVEASYQTRLFDSAESFLVTRTPRPQDVCCSTFPCPA